MLHTIDSDTPLDIVFIDFWETVEIPYWYGSRKIITFLDCMKGFGLVSASRLKEITSDQVSQ